MIEFDEEEVMAFNDAAAIFEQSRWAAEIDELWLPPTTPAITLEGWKPRTTQANPWLALSSVSLVFETWLL